MDMPARMRRFVEHPPRRLTEVAVRARKAKGSRKYPGSWLTECGDAQGWRCHYCGTLMRKKPHKTERLLLATLDHVVPLSAGGKNCRANVVAACVRCNQEKGSMPAAEYKALWRERHEARRHWSCTRDRDATPRKPVGEAGGVEAEGSQPGREADRPC